MVESSLSNSKLELKFQNPLMTDDLIFFKKCANLKQPYYIIIVHWSVKVRESERDAIVLLSYQVKEVKEMLVRDEKVKDV